MVKTIDQTFWTTYVPTNYTMYQEYMYDYIMDNSSWTQTLDGRTPIKRPYPPPPRGPGIWTNKREFFKKYMYVHPRNGRTDAQQAGQQTWVDAVAVSGADSRKTRESANVANAWNTTSKLEIQRQSARFFV